MTTSLYEGMFLFDSNLASKDWAGLEKHVQDILTKHGAEILYTEKWPDRRLAYDVKGCKKGTYYLTYFNAVGTAIDGMRRDIQLSERILRHLFVQEEGLEEEMEGRRKKEIEIPPAELSFGRDRGGFESSGRFRRDRDRGGRDGGGRDSGSASKESRGAQERKPAAGGSTETKDSKPSGDEGSTRKAESAGEPASTE